MGVIDVIDFEGNLNVSLLHTWGNYGCIAGMLVASRYKI